MADQRQSDILLLRQRRIGSAWVHQREPAKPSIPSLKVDDVQEDEEARNGEETTRSRQTPSGDEVTLPKENGHIHGFRSPLEEMVQESFESVCSSKASSTEREISPSSVDIELQGDATSDSLGQLSPDSIEVKVD